MKITLSPTDLLALIQTHLHSQNLHHTAHILSLESHLTVHKYGPDVSYFRDLCTSGKLSAALDFLGGVERFKVEYGRCGFLVRRQMFLEMLILQTSVTHSTSLQDDDDTDNAQSQSQRQGQRQAIPTSDDLVKILKSLEHTCTKTDFNNLCYCLTIPNLKHHPQQYYRKWSVHGGRFNLFEEVLPLLDGIFAGQGDKRGKYKHLNGTELKGLSKLAVKRQIYEYKRANGGVVLPSEAYAGILKEEFCYQSSGHQSSDNSRLSCGDHEGGGEKERMERMEKGGFDDGNEFYWANPTNENENGGERDGRNRNRNDIKDHRIRKRMNGSGSGSGSGGNKVPADEYTKKTCSDSNDHHHNNPNSNSGSYKVRDREDVIDIDDEKEVETETRQAVAWEIKMGDEEEEYEDDDDDDDDDDEANDEKSDNDYDNTNTSKTQLPPSQPTSNSTSTSLPPITITNPNDPYSTLLVSSKSPQYKYKLHSTLTESHPIRTVSFSTHGSGNVFCYGTNSKALRVCVIHDTDDDEGDNDNDGNEGTGTGTGKIEVIHERSSHHTGSIYCSSWSNDNTIIATCSNDKTIKLIRVNLSESQEAYSVEQGDVVIRGVHSGTVRSLNFAKVEEGVLVSTGSQNNLAVLWDVNRSNNSSTSTNSNNAKTPTPSLHTLAGHTDTVYSGKFHPTASSLLATCSQDQTVKTWDIRLPETSHNLATYNFDSVPLDLQHCTNTNEFGLYVTCFDGCVRYIDTRVGEVGLGEVVYKHLGQCRSIDITPCNRYVMSTGFDGVVNMFNPERKEVRGINVNEGERLLQARFRKVGGTGFVVAGQSSVQYWKA